MGVIIALVFGLVGIVIGLFVAPLFLPLSGDMAMWTAAAGMSAGFLLGMSS